MTKKKTSDSKLTIESITPLDLSDLRNLNVEDLNSTSFGGGQHAIKTKREQQDVTNKKKK